MSLECSRCPLVMCLSCEHSDRCPSTVMHGTMACEVWKLSEACREAKQTTMEELMKYKPSERTMYIAMYVLGFICGIIILLAFQGKI